MRSQGFTVLELIVTIAIAALTAMIAAPSLSRFVADNRIAAASNRLNATLQLARSEAVKRGVETVICKGSPASGCLANGGWHQGWFVFADVNSDRQCNDSNSDQRCDADNGRITLHQASIAQNTTISGGAGNTEKRVVFEPTGFANGYPGTFTICDRRGQKAAHGLVLSMTGRVRQANPQTDNLQCYKSP